MRQLPERLWTPDDIDLTPLSNDELAQRYRTFIVLGQGCVYDKASDALMPTGPPLADKDGIVGGRYRVQAALAAYILGLNVESDDHLLCFAGNEHIVGESPPKTFLGDESKIYSGAFDIIWQESERTTERILPQKFLFPEAGSTLGTIASMRRMEGAARHAIEAPRMLPSLMITNWFHVPRLAEMCRRNGELITEQHLVAWPLVSGSFTYVEYAFAAPLDPQKITVVSAERLLVTAGLMTAAQVRAAYGGPEAIEAARLRVSRERQGIEDLRHGCYRASFERLKSTSQADIAAASFKNWL